MEYGDAYEVRTRLSIPTLSDDCHIYTHCLGCFLRDVVIRPKIEAGENPSFPSLSSTSPLRAVHTTSHFVASCTKTSPLPSVHNMQKHAFSALIRIPHCDWRNISNTSKRRI